MIKSFLETANNTKFIRSLYHQALLSWQGYEDRTIPKPSNNPYYNIEMYNRIKEAVAQGFDISSMTCRDWYHFLMSSELEEPGPDGEMRLIPSGVEMQMPQNDWTHSWALARTKGLSSSSLSFLWKLLHQLLPTRERQDRILRDVNNFICQICNTGEQDTLPHALAMCPGSREIFEWMKAGLDKFSTGLTMEKIMVLDISISAPLPFNELPLIWFIAEVLKNLWETRSSGKPCRLNHTKAAVSAECEIMKQTKYGDIALIVELMF